MTSLSLGSAEIRLDCRSYRIQFPLIRNGNFLLSIILYDCNPVVYRYTKDPQVLNYKYKLLQRLLDFVT
jgi:hypothetical protein